MRSSSRIALVVGVTLLTSTAARAAGIDFKDPRRAVGREDNIRVDAQMLQDTLSAGVPISITYQIENLTATPIAIADRIATASFDPDSQTITLTIGAEIPQGTAMPHLITIAPGKTRVLRIAAPAQVVVTNAHTPWSHTPRLVQIVVNVLRDLGPFATQIEQQTRSTTAPPLPAELFDQWVASVSSVELNALPVRWTESTGGVTAEASRSTRGRGF